MKIGNGFQPLTIITKHSILDVAVALDPLLTLKCEFEKAFLQQLVNNTDRIVSIYNILLCAQDLFFRKITFRRNFKSYPKLNV